MGGGMAAIFEQEHFRVRSDTTTPQSGGTPTWISTEDQASNVLVPPDTTFRVRFAIANTGDSNAENNVFLGWNRNGTGWTVMSAGGQLIEPSTAASTVTAPVDIVATGDFLLTAGTGTAIDGQYTESNFAQCRLSPGERSEVEFGLILDGAQVNGGDTIELRVYNGISTPPDVVDHVLTIEVDAAKTASGSPSIPAVTASGNAAVTGFGNVRQAETNQVLETSISATFGQTPQSNNLLLAHVYQDSNLESVVSMTGWTQAFTHTTTTGRFTTFYRLSNGTEGTVTAVSDGSAIKIIQIEELFGPFLSPDPLVNATGSTETINTTSHDSGSLISGQADDLAISVHTFASAAITATAFNNSFVEYRDQSWELIRRLAKSRKTLTTFGASTTATSSSSTTSYNHILIFRPAGGAKTASGNPSIPATTASGTAKVHRSASGSPSIPAVTASGVAKVVKKATGAATLAAIAASGTADTFTLITASGAADVPAITASGTAKRVHSASGAATVPAVTASGAATVHRSASGAADIPVTTASGAATVVRIASDGTPTLTPLTASGNATVGASHTASGNGDVPASTASGSATVNRQASGAATLAPLTASGAATVHREASGSPSIPAVTASGNAIVQGIISANGNGDVPALTASGNAVRKVIATGSSAGTFTYVGGAANNGPSISSPNVTHGLSIQSGDLIVAYVHSNQTGAITPDETWDAELFDEEPDSVTETSRNAMYWKVATGSEPSNYGWTAGAASWGVVLKVFRPSGGTIAVDLTALKALNGNSIQAIRCVAQNGRTAATDAVSIVCGGKDNRTGADDPITAADNGYTGAIGNGNNQITGMAHKIGGGAEPAQVDLTGQATSDISYSYHVSFVLTGGGGGGVVPAITASGNATVGATHTASGNGDVPAATASGTAKVVKTASGAATLTPLTASGAATVNRQASGAATLTPLTASGNAVVQGIISASGNGNVPAVTASGAATVHRSASGAADTPAVTASGNAIVQGIIAASGNGDVPATTASGAATVHREASGAATTPAVTASGTAAVVKTASGAATVPAVTASGAATVNRQASGAATTPAVTASGAATVHREASGAATLAPLTASGNAAVGGVHVASGAATVPALTASGSTKLTRHASGNPQIPAITADGNATGPQAEVTTGGGSGGHGAVILPQRPPQPEDETEPASLYDPELAELVALALVAIDIIEDLEK